MLTYELDRTRAMSLYEQLYRCIRADIEAGILRPDERLPSKRTLARHLGVSPITVEGALAQLAAEGYVSTHERKGCYVCALDGASRATAPPVHGTAVPPAPERLATSTRAHKPASLADLTGAEASRGLFPYQRWAAIVRSVLADETEETLLTATQPQGSPALRAAIAEHLRGFRGMDVDPDRIVVGAGAQVLYQLIAQLLGTGARIALEDPGYPRLQCIYEALGMSTCAIPVIGDGSSLSQLGTLTAHAIHCMPSHHFPTGAVIAAPARYQLLDWAHSAQGRYLIEDDYDCEFRMQGKPITALASLGSAEKVIYLNTFTKSLGSAFRIGYMVLPPDLMGAFRERLGFYSCTVGGIDQAALRRFMTTGGYERHCNRLRTHYRHISQLLAYGLGEATAPWDGRLEQVGAGLHFTLHIPNVRTAQQEDALVQALDAEGVRVSPLRAFRYQAASTTRSTPELTGVFLIAFSSVQEERIERIVYAFERALSAVLGAFADRSASKP